MQEAECKKQKSSVRPHHYPLGSARLVDLCSHCYEVLRRQRRRNASFGRGFS
jgi:hypothetical protein